MSTSYEIGACINNESFGSTCDVCKYPKHEHIYVQSEHSQNTFLICRECIEETLSSFVSKLEAMGE